MSEEVVEPPEMISRPAMLAVPLADRTFAAAAAVSGPIANILTSGTPASQIPQLLYRLAYNKDPGGPNVLYNGIGFGLPAKLSTSNTSQSSVGPDAIAASRNASMVVNGIQMALPVFLENPNGDGQNGLAADSTS